MDQNTGDGLRLPEASEQDPLTGILRNGAQRLLAQAVEAEVEGYLAAHRDRRDAPGHRPIGMVHAMLR